MHTRMNVVFYSSTVQYNELCKCTHIGKFRFCVVLFYLFFAAFLITHFQAVLGKTPFLGFSINRNREDP